MFCANCGAPLPEGARFCASCGAAVSPEEKLPAPRQTQKPAPKQFTAPGRSVSENIVLCPDGKYRWVYELNLFTNPTVFVLVWKIFFFIILGIFAFMALLDLIDGDIGRMAENLPFLLYFLLGMTALVALGYLIYAAVMGGKYCVLFEMDGDGINHKQMPRQAEKAALIADLAVLAGLAAGRITTVGVGLNAQRTEMYSDFAAVRTVKPFPRRNLIKVNERLGHNQVYAAREDFAFVLDYILSHCPNLSVK